MPGSSITPWANYIDFKSISVTNLWDVIDTSTNLNEHFFNDSNYQTLFNVLKKTSNQQVENSDSLCR